MIIPLTPPVDDAPDLSQLWRDNVLEDEDDD